MGRFDYRESNFSAGKFIICLLISLFAIGLVFLIYTTISGTIGIIPGILAGIGILSLLIIASLMLKSYNYSYQGPPFVLVFIPVLIIAFTAALLAGIGPLENMKKSLFASFQSKPQQVVQIPNSTTSPASDKPATPATGTPAASPAPTTTTAQTTGGNNAATTPAAPTVSASIPATAEIAALEQALHDEINAIRREGGLISFQRIAFLDELAREQSLYMLRQGKLSHDTFYSYTHPAIIKTLKVSMTGENVLFVSEDMDDAKLMAELWFQSSDHRDNILNTSFRRTGIGIAAGNGRIYATQIYTD